MDQGIECKRYVPFGCLIVEEEPRARVWMQANELLELD